jgi:hypothetical protein
MLTALLSWNSRLRRLLNMGEYMMFFLNHDILPDCRAKYRCVSLLRLLTCLTYLTREVVPLQRIRTAERQAQMMSRYEESASFSMSGVHPAACPSPAVVAAAAVAAPLLAVEFDVPAMMIYRDLCVSDSVVSVNPTIQVEI